jgi:ABC-type anion transport system duplicated permease subunit
MDFAALATEIGNMDLTPIATAVLGIFVGILGFKLAKRMMG